MITISNEDFKVFKECLPLCTNIIKPTKNHILEHYDNMNKELDNLTFGIIDIVHPKIMKAYRKRKIKELNEWMNAIGNIVDRRYIK